MRISLSIFCFAIGAFGALALVAVSTFAAMAAIFAGAGVAVMLAPGLPTADNAGATDASSRSPTKAGGNQ